MNKFIIHYEYPKPAPNTSFLNSDSFFFKKDKTKKADTMIKSLGLFDFSQKIYIQRSHSEDIQKIEFLFGTQRQHNQ